MRKNLAEHWYLPNTGIFYSKDVASVKFCQCVLSCPSATLFLLLLGAAVVTKVYSIVVIVL
jgi:hypothetical protein